KCQCRLCRRSASCRQRRAQRWYRRTFLLVRTACRARFVCHRTFDSREELPMKHAFAFVGVVFAAAALHAQEPSTFKFEVQTRVPLETRTVKNAPYSAEVITDHMQQLADGNRIVEHSSGRVYRDREGRVRREDDRPSGNPSISIVDPVAGVSYSLDPERRIAWKSSAQV